MGRYLSLALGVFVGNLLVVPTVFDSRTVTDGFFIGLIAALLVLGIGAVVSRENNRKNR